MIESQYGDKTFPSFVKWLVGWRVSYEDLKHNRVKIFLRTFWQEVHTDLCPDPDEDTPVACAFNPHWDQLQQRFLSHYFDLPPLPLFLFPRCFYCALTYRVIAKFETFQEDLRSLNIILLTIDIDWYDCSRYIGYLANVTFNEGVQENRTGKRTSSRALSFFKQVSFFLQKWFYKFVAPQVLYVVGITV